VEKLDILSMTQAELEAIVQKINQPQYRAKQLWGWLHIQRVREFAQMANLPKAMREALAEHYYIATATAVKTLVSQNDGTTKHLFAMHDSVLIESVLMKYNHGNTICISTQAGCRMGCVFCASAEGGLVRNLTAGEMCAQVYAAGTSKISGVVLMGCGEPLDNFDETLRFLHLISHPDGLNIGQRHITLSTCGLVPQILELAEHKLQITLAISLHGATDEVRQRLMPIAKRYSLTELIPACREYIKATNRRLTFEYALVKGVNDSPSHARDLVKLLRGINCHVNLIPVNKRPVPKPASGIIARNFFEMQGTADEAYSKHICKEAVTQQVGINSRKDAGMGLGNRSSARGEYSGTARKEATAFAEVLQKGRIQTTVRRSLGSDVDAACGQLRAQHRVEV